MSGNRKRSYSIGCRCVVCKRPFRASRRDAKYCSGKCRQVASRSRGGQKKKDNLSDVSQMSMRDLDGLLEKQILMEIDFGA